MEKWPLKRGVGVKINKKRKKKEKKALKQGVGIINEIGGGERKEKCTLFVL